MVLLEGKGGLELGDEIPQFNLKNIDNSLLSSDSLKKQVKLIVFTCNHCPYAQAGWPKLVHIYSKFKDRVDFVAINSNDAVNYPEDSFENMKPFAQEHSIPFPYLHDETQEVAKAYGAKCTPDVYVFHNDTLQYRGRIDSQFDAPYSETEHDLENALQEITQTGKFTGTSKPSMGCSIKWKT
ncbi:MAG: thioredoxin family protein [DPANN group archaeon]|nr:thioredoxin family protein [DPANN group archaeon]